MTRRVPSERAMPPEGHQPNAGMAAAITRSLLIFPCNGNGLEALDCLAETDRFLGFIDDTLEKRERAVGGFQVFGRSAFALFADAGVLAVPGSPASFRTRAQVIQGLGLAPERFATVVHPRATVSPRATLGRNVLIMAGAVITSNAVVEDNVCVLPNTVVHHDVVIGQWSLIGSSVVLTGGVVVGENCYVGSGSTIMPYVSLGAQSLIGLGSNVTRDVPHGAVVAGNPAAVLRRPER